MVFSGDIEIDEAKFGRKRKNQMGAEYGMNVWVVGLVERATNRIIMYPVMQRTADVLIPIIEKHVERGKYMWLFLT